MCVFLTPCGIYLTRIRFVSLTVFFFFFLQDAQAVENPILSADLLQPVRLCDSSATDCKTASSEVSNISTTDSNARSSGYILESDSKEPSPSTDCEPNFSVEPDCLPVTSSHESLCDDQKG